MHHLLENHSDLVRVVFDTEATWDHSQFPHPLVTIDFDAKGPFAVSALGPKKDLLALVYAHWLVEGGEDIEAFFTALRRTIEKIELSEDSRPYGAFIVWSDANSGDERGRVQLKPSAIAVGSGITAETVTIPVGSKITFERHNFDPTVD